MDRHLIAFACLSSLNFFILQSKSLRQSTVWPTIKWRSIARPHPSRSFLQSFCTCQLGPCPRLSYKFAKKSSATHLIKGQNVLVTCLQTNTLCSTSRRSSIDVFLWIACLTQHKVESNLSPKIKLLLFTPAKCWLINFFHFLLILYKFEKKTKLRTLFFWFDKDKAKEDDRAMMLIIHWTRVRTWLCKQQWNEHRSQIYKYQPW